MPRPLSEVTNREIIDALFSDLPAGAQPEVCSKAGDPTQGGWYAQPASVAVNVLSPDRNNYVNCSSFRPDAEGRFAAKNEQFAACHTVLIDDWGTKVPREKLNGLKFTAVIETSQGNFQGLIKLKRPIQPALAKRLIAALIKKGLTDPGATGHNRWARLPVGINGKEKYRDAAGHLFRCRLVEFNPEQAYFVAEIVTLLELDMSSTEDPTRPAVPSQDLEVLTVSSSISELAAYLAQLDPNMGREDWIRVLMAIWHATQGSEEGFELVNRWSSAGKTYPGTAAVRVQWKSFRNTDKPVTLGTLMHMVRESGGAIHGFMPVGPTKIVNVPHTPTASVAVAMEAAADKADTVQDVTPASLPEPAPTAKPISLRRYAVTNNLAPLISNVMGQKLVLGRLAVAGQFTVFYASPNTGKTLITLRLIRDSVTQKWIDADLLFYINMDDSASGLLEKSRFAIELGFHMIGGSYQHFSTDKFHVSMREMIDSNTAKGVVVVLDTLKKFTKLMNKDDSSQFAAMVRQFTLKGGTVIALAHANKRPDPDGNPVYQGTTDILDDCDCAYTLKSIADDADGKVVEFTNIKRRGDVVANAWYRYSTDGSSYAALLESVKAVDPAVAETLKQDAALTSETPVIDAIRTSIREGINTKMNLAKAVASRAGCSGKQAIQLIEKYTGTDPAKHHWFFEVKARGAQVFVLHGASGLPEPVATVAPIAPITPAPAVVEPDDTEPCDAAF